jgi:hypothetical protein
MAAQTVDRHPDRSQRVSRRRQERAPRDLLTQVSGCVEAGVVPLPIEGQTVRRQPSGVERGGKRSDVDRPGGELLRLLRAPPDLARRAICAEPGGQRSEDLGRKSGQAAQAEPHAFEEHVGRP